MQYIQVKNWEAYQHYKNRNPPWIKFYHQLLDDYEYSCLQDASKLLLITLFLLAAKTNNKIPKDEAWIKQKGMIKGKIDLSELVSSGFIKIIGDDSNKLSDCKQDASKLLFPEEKRREEKEKSIYGHAVKLFPEQYEKLKADYGEKILLDIFDDLDEYIISKHNGRDPYADHNLTIRKWLKKRDIQPIKQTQQQKECQHCHALLNANIKKCPVCEKEVIK